MTRIEFIAARIEFYRARGECYGDATAWAKMDADARY